MKANYKNHMLIKKILMNRIKLFSVGPAEEEKIAGVTVPK